MASKGIARIISSKVQALEAQLERTYARFFPKGADVRFWHEVNTLDSELGSRLKDATPLEVQAACRTFSKGFNRACMEGRKRAKQA